MSVNPDSPLRRPTVVIALPIGNFTYGIHMQVAGFVLCKIFLIFHDVMLSLEATHLD